MADNVRFLAVARVPDKVIVATFVSKESRDLPRALMEDKMRVVLSSRRILEHKRLTIADKDCGCIHYDCYAACLYLAVTQPEYPQRAAFKLLIELQQRFENAFGMEMGGAGELDLSRPARELLVDVAEKFDDVGAVDKVANVALQVLEVKDVMQTNIKAVLKNQENLKTLLRESGGMRQDASEFGMSAAKTRDKMLWKNYRLIVAIVLLFALLSGVTVASVYISRAETRGKVKTGP